MEQHPWQLASASDPAFLEEIREWIRSHPKWSRWRLSRGLCEHWDWRNEAGQLRDMSVRLLLNRLEAQGLLELPAKRKRGCVGGAGRTESVARPSEPIEDSLNQLTPIRLIKVKASDALKPRWTGYLQQYHYLGYRGAAGRKLRYLIRDREDRDLGCLLFAAAARRVRCRDHWIGWSDSQRAHRLQWIANNSRFLLLPWVRVPHLASHVLALACRELRRDWQECHGHDIWVVETFVEQSRFHGTCYRAANFLRLGQTQGRGRYDRDNTASLPIKTVYVRELHRQSRRRLCEL